MDYQYALCLFHLNTINGPLVTMSDIDNIWPAIRPLYENDVCKM